MLLLDALTASGEFFFEELGHQTEAYSDRSTPSSLNNDNSNGQ